jgi:hypothetical protein
MTRLLTATLSITLVPVYRHQQLANQCSGSAFFQMDILTKKVVEITGTGVALNY